MKFLFMQLLPQQPGGLAQPGGDPREQLLAQLHDVISPAPISWWPPALGWWLLAALVIGLSIVSVYYVKKVMRQKKYRREAIALIQALPTSENTSLAEYTHAVASILKRCFFYAYPEAKYLATQAYGEKWQELLASKLPHSLKVTPIPWASILYSTDSHTLAKTDIKSFAILWIKKHQTDKKKTDRNLVRRSEVNHVSV